MSGTQRVADMWANTEAAERSAETNRQAALKETNLEADRLAKLGESNRRQVDEALSAKKRILDEMRVVRNQMQDKMISARAKAAHDTDVANRALARAQQRARNARLESQSWQDKAGATENRAREVATREMDALALLAKGSDFRIAEAQDQGVERQAHGQRLVAETQYVCEEMRQRHDEQCRTQERYAARSRELHAANAVRVQQKANTEVRAAMDASKQAQSASVRDIQQSREAAMQKVADAQQELLRKRRECEQMLDCERICAAQARKITKTLTQQQEAEKESEQRKLEGKLQAVNVRAVTMGNNYEEELQLTIQRSSEWSDRTDQNLKDTREFLRDQEVKATERVSSAKVMLANLQAQCAAYLRDLEEQWEEAKRQDAKKVAEANTRTEGLMKYCDETLQVSERQLQEMLEKAQKVQDQKEAHLKMRVEGIDNLGKQTVAMMQQQAKDRRCQAEKHLEDFKQHVEEVRTQCKERVRIEAETAEERVQLSVARFAAEVDKAARRQAEAEVRLEQARATHAAALSRCKGAAAEARWRGMGDIADVIEPAEPVPMLQGPGEVLQVPEEGAEGDPAADVLADEPAAGQGETVGDITATQDADKDAMMATASTMLPDDAADGTMKETTGMLEPTPEAADGGEAG